MSQANVDRIRQHYEALHDDELLRTAILEGGTLVEPAQEVVRKVVEERLGRPVALVTGATGSMGKLWGRIQEVRTFTRLRGPLDPVLGARDVSPGDGVLLLSDRGLGFVPLSPPPPTELFPTLPEPGQGPVGAWWQALLNAAAVPAELRDARAVYRLPLALRARLDPTSAWIPLDSLERLELQQLDLQVVVAGAGDAVCRLPPPAPELLGRWGTQFHVTLHERDDTGVASRVRGWLRRD